MTKLAILGIVASTIDRLQRQPSDIAGEDSGLGNVWLEFCAQVQGEQSSVWDQFVEHVHQTIEGVIFGLSAQDREHLWLSTSEGRYWQAQTDAENATPPVDSEDLLERVYGRVWQRAADFESARLSRYLTSGGDD